MSDKKEKRRHRRRRRRAVRLIFNIIVLVIILYLATLAVSIFGGGNISDKLRKYDAVDAPANYIEKTFNLNTVEIQEQDVLIITVTEDVAYIDGEEIALTDIEDIAAKAQADKAVLIDDGAKHVTYSQIYNELDRLGLAIEEK